MERRVSEKEETWTLAKECDEFSSRIPEPKDPKSKVDQEQKDTEKRAKKLLDDKSDNVETTIFRGHETRKSKTRRVKSYLRKCKGALSKSEDNSVERKRDSSNSWYVEGPSGAGSKPDISEHVVANDDLEETIFPVSQEVEIIKPETSDVLDSENLQIELDESKRDFDKGSKGSLYEDATDVGVQEAGEEKTPTRDLDNLVEGSPTEKDPEILAIEDSNLNKCDSSDTLIAEVPEVPRTPVEFNAELCSSEPVGELLTLNEDCNEIGASEEATGPLTVPNFGVSSDFHVS